ncbi:MAG TPA: hypothetical protein DCZ91_23620 [Lachnospiraceae bacterium]|nr:hypothetical protein [Lachnospiraceae bacterium]
MKAYLEKYRSRLFLTGLLVFLVHGARMNAGIIGIDTEDLLHLQDDFYGGWLHTGRQGLVFLKYFLGNAQYNPFFSGTMTVLLFAVSVAAFLSLWDRAGRPAGLWGWGCGALLWVSHPAMAEQFYFSLQGMEICLGIGLTALALYFSFRWARGDGAFWAVGGGGILLLTFSVYQIFVVLYIFGTVALLLCQALGEVAEGGKPEGKGLFKHVVPYCAVFLGAFLLNTVITRLFFGSSDYLQNQIYWGHASVKDCLHAIAGHVVKAFTGYGSIFYHPGLGVLALFDFVLLYAFLARLCPEKGSGKAVILFFYLAMLATPFMMTVLLGGMPAMRSQMVLPAMTGFLGYLGIWLAQRQELDPGIQQESGPGIQQEPCVGIQRDSGSGIQQEPCTGIQQKRLYPSRQHGVLLCSMAAVCLISGSIQAKVTGRLYYTDWCRYEQDAALGRSVIERIEQVMPEGEPLPVMVVGGREFSGNNACVTGEVIGRSFFSYDREVEPVPFWSTRRVLGFLHTLGADYVQAPKERAGEALDSSADMPVWPGEGSVQVKNGMIIVKLSLD